ncbi:unnamed protein product [Scytosiphon promiscuus]
MHIHPSTDLCCCFFGIPLARVHLLVAPGTGICTPFRGLASRPKPSCRSLSRAYAIVPRARAATPRRCWADRWGTNTHAAMCRKDPRLKKKAQVRKQKKKVRGRAACSLFSSPIRCSRARLAPKQHMVSRTSAHDSIMPKLTHLDYSLLLSSLHVQDSDCLKLPSSTSPTNFDTRYLRQVPWAAYKITVTICHRHVVLRT